MKVVETAINEKGQSHIHSITNPQSWNFSGDLEGFAITDLFFSLESTNMSLSNSKPNDEEFNLKPGQIRFFLNEVPPTKPLHQKLIKKAPNLILEKMFYHSTTTVDYIFVIDGPLVLVAGDDVVELQTGDCIVQRGAGHSWQNYTDKIAKFVVVMVGTKPSKEF